MNEPCINVMLYDAPQPSVYCLTHKKLKLQAVWFECMQMKFMQPKQYGLQDMIDPPLPLPPDAAPCYWI